MLERKWQWVEHANAARKVPLTGLFGQNLGTNATSERSGKKFAEAFDNNCLRKCKNSSFWYVSMYNGDINNSPKYSHFVPKLKNENGSRRYDWRKRKWKHCPTQNSFCYVTFRICWEQDNWNTRECTIKNANPDFCITQKIKNYPSKHYITIIEWTPYMSCIVAEQYDQIINKMLSEVYIFAYFNLFRRLMQI